MYTLQSMRILLVTLTMSNLSNIRYQNPLLHLRLRLRLVSLHQLIESDILNNNWAHIVSRLPWKARAYLGRLIFDLHFVVVVVVSLFCNWES